MSRMPVGGQGEQPRHGKRGQKQRASIDSGSSPIQDLETRRKFNKGRVCVRIEDGGESHGRNMPISIGRGGNGCFDAKGVMKIGAKPVSASTYSHSWPIASVVTLPLSAEPTKADTAGHSGLDRGEDQDPSSDQVRSKRELEAKINCATTILAWSRHKDNAQRLAKVCVYVRLWVGVY